MRLLKYKQMILLLMAVLLPWVGDAQIGNGNSLPDSTTIISMMKDKNVPVLGIAYIEDGQVKQAGVYGTLDNGMPAPITTIFNVASITKTITAMVTMRLVEQGKWDLDEPICHYWTDPDVKDDARSKRLTTRHILTHQTGFPNWRRMTATGKLEFEFEPGTKFQYSGEGMEYLRHALEQKFHCTLDKLADSLIFGPLQMTNTHLLWNDSMLGDFAVAHDSSGIALAINKNNEASAADLLKTTVTDYSRFMIWIMNGAGLTGDLYTQLTSPLSKIKDNKYMGLGWAVYTGLPGDEVGMSHSGHDEGVHTIAIILPGSKRGLLIFTNSDNGWQLYNDLAVAFLGKQGQAIANIEMKN